jgi:dipeptidyl aminopeptidase/acylaminoacyl peptidase
MTVHAVALVSLLLFSSAAAIAASSTGEKTWTPESSVRTRYYVRQPETAQAPGWLVRPGRNDAPAVFSPDKSRFFLVSHYGDPERDEIVAELSIYTAAQVTAALRRGQPGPLAPEHTVVFRSSSSDEGKFPILKPHWESDRTLLFLGTRGDRQGIYRFDVTKGTESALTNAGHDATSWYGTAGPDSRSLIFMARRVVPWTPLDHYPGVFIKSDELTQLQNPFEVKRELFASHKGAPPQKLLGLETGALLGPWISPDESYAVIGVPTGSKFVPVHWRGYDVAPESGLRFMLVDMRTGSATQMLDAPVGTVTNGGRGHAQQPMALWSADSRHVVLFNTALPLESTTRAARKSMSYLVDYSMEDRQWKEIAPVIRSTGERVVSLTWIREGNVFGLDRQPAGSGEPDRQMIEYIGVGGGWRLAGNPRAIPPAAPVESPSASATFDVRLVEDVNEPPRIVASSGNHTLLLTEPDPALIGVRRARGEIIEWRERGGATEKGILMLPRTVNRTAPPPLVIQGGVTLDAFRPDGSTLSAFTAQGLVSQGFAVLQLNISLNESTMMTPREGPSHVERVDAAVAELEAKGIIDSSRVGIIGFSRSGYAAYYIITHPGKTRVSAAVVFDSITNSYGEYVIQAGLGDPQGTAHYGRQYGGGTFWDNKQGWLDAPAFNVEKVQAPVLFSTANKQYAGFSALETIGAFRQARKPFDYMMFTNGSHQLQLPRERMHAMQATLDWMSFWLQNKERADATDDRFVRWRQLRAEWEASREKMPSSDGR